MCAVERPPPLTVRTVTAAKKSPARCPHAQFIMHSHPQVSARAVERPPPLAVLRLEPL